MNLEQLLSQTQQVMAQNLAQNLYGPNGLRSRLEKASSKKTALQKAKSWLGDKFLAIANALGSYNDYD